MMLSWVFATEFGMGESFGLLLESFEVVMSSCLGIRKHRWSLAWSGLTVLFSNRHLPVLNHGALFLSHQRCPYHRRTLFFCAH
jgi:hypothetical protein